jgi:3-methyladenine DNA glycosylase AlkC
MEPFKNIFNKESIQKLAKEIKNEYPAFDDKSFQQSINKTLTKLELKDRVRLVAKNLKEYLPNNYKQSVKILVSTLAAEEKHADQEWSGQDVEGVNGFMVWPLTQFVEEFGLDDLDTSMQAMYEMTKRFSAEFAIRPFIQKYDKKVYRILSKWSKDPSKHVRRLVSEGTRPNLPWGMKVPVILEDIERNIKLIEKLKDDPQDYVRRSVANHLNDISRINKKIMLETCKKWHRPGHSETDWIIRHATRSLLKAGDKTALELNGFTANPKIEIKKLKLTPKKIKEGDSFDLKFCLESLGRKEQHLLVDYIIHYPKKNGKTSPKVFRLKQLKLKAGESIDLSKKIGFKKVTTRVHYPGKHLVEIKVGAKVVAQTSFTLI